MYRHPGKGSVQRPIAPDRHFVRQGACHDLHLLLSVGSLLRRLERDQPMQVRVGEGVCHLAAAAITAGLCAASLTQQQLGKPQGKALLPDAFRAFQKQGLRQPARLGGGRQAAAHGFMTV
jgi:hypothetical protein